MSDLNNPEANVVQDQAGTPDAGFGSGSFKEEFIDSTVVSQDVNPLPLTTLNNLTTPTKMPSVVSHIRRPLEAMSDVSITVVFEVGRTPITIKELMELTEGAFIDLRNVSVDSIEARVNDVLIAHGEAIALQQRYGIRIGEIENFSDIESEVNHA